MRGERRAGLNNISCVGIIKCVSLFVVINLGALGAWVLLRRLAYNDLISDDKDILNNVTDGNWDTYITSCGTEDTCANQHDVFKNGPFIYTADLALSDLCSKQIEELRCPYKDKSSSSHEVDDACQEGIKELIPGGKKCHKLMSDLFSINELHVSDTLTCCVLACVVVGGLSATCALLYFSYNIHLIDFYRQDNGVNNNLEEVLINQLRSRAEQELAEMKSFFKNNSELSTEDIRTMLEASMSRNVDLYENGSIDLINIVKEAAGLSENDIKRIEQEAKQKGFICPLGLCIMFKPYIYSDKKNYEWFNLKQAEESQGGVITVSPFHRGRVDPIKPIENITLRDCIREWFCEALKEGLSNKTKELLIRQRAYMSFLTKTD